MGYCPLQADRRRDSWPPEYQCPWKNKAFALGSEVSLALARKGVVYGSLKVNYQWEVFARTTTQGSALTVMTTFLVPPLKLPGTK